MWYANPWANLPECIRAQLSAPHLENQTSLHSCCPIKARGTVLRSRVNNLKRASVICDREHWRPICPIYEIGCCLEAINAGYQSLHPNAKVATWKTSLLFLRWG